MFVVLKPVGGDVITGASAGIGKACADRLAAAEWAVTGASRRGSGGTGHHGVQALRPDRAVFLIDHHHVGPGRCQSLRDDGRGNEVGVSAQGDLAAQTVPDG